MSCTVTPATGALLRLSKTTPEGSISRVVVTDTATLPQCVTFAVTTSLRSTSRTPAPEATGRVVASAVGTSAWTRNRPVPGAVSVATNESTSPVGRTATLRGPVDTPVGTAWPGAAP